jgi:hypothetical protein
MKHLDKILNIAGGVALVSSFFIKDNKKAVNTRWAALGLFGAAWISRITKISK